MPAVPYQAPAYVDWSQAGLWTVPAAAPYPLPAMPSALMATPYMDFNGYGMASSDMMFTGFQPGSNAGALRISANVRSLRVLTHPGLPPQPTCRWCTTRSRSHTAWLGWSSASRAHPFMPWR